MGGRTGVLPSVMLDERAGGPPSVVFDLEGRGATRCIGKIPYNYFCSVTKYIYITTTTLIYGHFKLECIKLVDMINI